MQPFAATLVSLAALGADNARFVVQLPEEGLVAAAPHERDTLTSACRLHLDGDGNERVVEVDALKALSDAKVQCTVSPGVLLLLAAAACCVMLLEELGLAQGRHVGRLAAPQVLKKLCFDERWHA